MSVTQRQRLEHCGELVYADAILHDPLEAEKCRGADILIVTPRLHQDVVAVLDHCRLISVQAVGTDCLDMVAATRKGILVTNAANASLTRVAVAEHAFALLLALARRLPEGAHLLRARLWRTGIAYQPMGLAGKTLGIVGWGGIGQNIAGIARGFGLQLLVWTAHPEKYRQIHPGVRFVSLADLLTQSDFVILAVPATPQTRQMISTATLAQMKPTALLVNVGRGSLVVEEDLAAAVRDGVIAGAATDVFVQEPPPSEHPLLSLPEIVATPHIAGATPEAISALLDQSISNVEAYLAGRPINVVNPEALRQELGP